MCKTIHLFRHSKTAWNEEGRLQGWLDSPLLQLPEASSLHVDYVIASDLGRAVATAQALFPTHTVHTDARFREIYLGHWQGARIAQLQQQAAYRCYMRTPAQFQPTTQQSFEAVGARMLEGLRALLSLPYDTIAVVSHGIAIACVQCLLQRQTFEHVHDYVLEGGQSMIVNEKDLQLNVQNNEVL